jgi:hypothetical protein
MGKKKVDLKDCGIYVPIQKNGIIHEKEEDTQMITKLRQFDFFCNNEIEVSSILKERNSEREKRFFQLFKKIKRVQFMREKEKDNEDFDYHVIMMYNNSAETLLSIQAFFSQSSYTSIRRQYKYNIITSFKNLLSAIQVMEEEYIVFPRLTEDCIYVDKKTGDILLSNLNKSLVINEERKSNLTKNGYKYDKQQKMYDSGYTVEQYIMRYMNENELVSLSAGNIEDAIAFWKRSLSFIDISIREEFKRSFISLINKSKASIFSRILGLSNTWSCYGLCVLYYCFIQEMALKDIFFQHFSHFLKNVIEEQPFQRRGSKYLLECFDTLVYGLKREEWL